MLDTLRRGSSGFTAKVLLSALVVSFAVWGIGDIFQGFGAGTVVRVGDREIGVEQYRTSLNSELQRVSRQVGRPISIADGRALGIDQRVLGELVAEATLDARADALGLAVSDQTVARSITEDPVFRGADGKFDVRRFDEILRASGLNEHGFVAAQRRFILRRQIIDGLTGEIPAPEVLLKAIHRYQTEARTVSYVALQAASLGEIADPEESVLTTLFEERKAAFRTPERRTIAVLVATGDSLAAAETVSDADVQAAYEREKATFSVPERRTVERIVFSSMDEARAASEKIKAGVTFDDLIKERNLTPGDYQLGTVTREGILDAPIAAAAFALPQGQVSEPVQGQFTAALVRVTAIEPGSVRSLDEVREDLRRRLANDRGTQRAIRLHDEIEDARASGETLAEAAEKLKLELKILENVDARGHAEDGTDVAAGIPDREQMLAAAFRSVVGVETDPLSIGNAGYVWFELRDVQPERDRTFEEARADVLARWRSDEIRRRLQAKSDEAVAGLRAGTTTLADLAADHGVEVLTVANVTRSGNSFVFDRASVAQVFATPQGGFAAASGVQEPDRVVFQVTGVTIPPFNPEGEQARQFASAVAETLQNDLATQYVMTQQADLGVTMNQQALAMVLGGPQQP